MLELVDLLEFLLKRVRGSLLVPRVVLRDVVHDVAHDPLLLVHD